MFKFFAKKKESCPIYISFDENSFSFLCEEFDEITLNEMFLAKERGNRSRYDELVSRHYAHQKLMREIR